MSNNFTSFEDQVEESKQELFEILNEIDFDKLKERGVLININGKMFRFSDVEVIEEESIEEKIRKELREEINVQQKSIREKINNKINQLLTMHTRKQSELEQKERKLEEKYSNISLMPDITFDHLKKGVFVCRGNQQGELIWGMKAIYKPLTVDKYSILKEHRERMKRDCYVIVRTKQRNVIDVDVYDNGLKNALDHYHFGCWGKWKYPKTFNNPNDIIQIMKDAMAVLSNINSGSVAKRQPIGMPRISTVLNRKGESKLETMEEEEDEDVFSV